jgi:microcystin-dependent protein
MEGTLAEIRMFAGNFAPRGWLMCSGQLLSISQNSAVFALLGTTYGGNGQTTFGVPDFRGRIGLGAQFSQGPGLPAITLGQMGGTENTTLLVNNLPSHNHTLTGNITPQGATTGLLLGDPSNRRTGAANIYTDRVDELVDLQPMTNNLAISVSGNSQPFGNRSPYLGLNFIMCVEGIFPSRN